MISIAIHNIHRAQNIKDLGIHNYILELVRQGYIKYLFFDESDFIKKMYLYRALKSESFIPKKYLHKDTQYIFSKKELFAKCDVILNFNTYTKDHDFTEAIKKFNGIKIWHIGDYFWNEPGSVINSRLLKYGINYLFGYSSHDKHCSYFQKTFPKYTGKVIPVAFGYQERFKRIKPFDSRINKCVGLGSVNPLRPLEYPIVNYVESARHFPDDAWFHKFRRTLVLNQDSMSNHFDSMLPEYPKIKDFKYDLVKKFNNYKMFTSCESIFNFPPAKFFEGPACGSVLVCANIKCNSEYGFKDSENCIMYDQYNIVDFIEKINYYKQHSNTLNSIQQNGYEFVTTHYNHKSIAKYIFDRVNKLQR